MKTKHMKKYDFVFLNEELIHEKQVCKNHMAKNIVFKRNFMNEKYMVLV